MTSSIRIARMRPCLITASAISAYRRGLRHYGEHNIPEALAAFETAAKQGNPWAHLSAVSCLTLQKPLDKSCIREHLFAAAEDFDADAMYIAAFLFENGLICDDNQPDPVSALHWYRMAANEGHDKATESYVTLAMEYPELVLQPETNTGTHPDTHA